MLAEQRRPAAAGRRLTTQVDEVADGADAAVHRVLEGVGAAVVEHLLFEEGITVEPALLPDALGRDASLPQELHPIVHQSFDEVVLEQFRGRTGGRRVRGEILGRQARPPRPARPPLPVRRTARAACVTQIHASRHW